MTMRDHAGRACPAFLLVMLLGLLSVGVAACGGDDQEGSAATGSSGTTSGASKEVTKVKCVMGYTWAIGPYYAGYTIGVKAGIYEKHGLDVTFEQGTGSSTTLQMLANGNADFGCAVAAGALIRLVSSGAPIRMIAGTVPDSSLATLSLKDAPINAPADMVGKKIGIPPGAEQEGIWPALMKSANLTQEQIDKIEVVRLGGDALPAALQSGRIDGYASSWLDLPGLAAAGIDAVSMDWADYGVKYSPMEGVAATTSTIEDKPDLVKEFVAAVGESWQYAIDNPDETVDYYQSLHPEVDKAYIRGQLDLVNEALQGQGSVFAKLDTTTWKAATDLLSDYAGLKDAAPPEDYYTSEFVDAFAK